MLAQKATDTLPFTSDGDLFRFACDVLLIGCEPGYVEEKIREFARFDRSNDSYGLLYQIIFGDTLILPRYIDSLFSIVVQWRLDIGERELVP